jgi:hypothetical protein
VIDVTGTIIGALFAAIISHYFTKYARDKKWRKKCSQECNQKWTLGIVNDNGWQPVLERYPDSNSWEYIYINSENKPIIYRIAYSEVPQVNDPFGYDKNEDLRQYLQEMVDRGQGNIIGLKARADIK